jgi:hypothetical protein
VPGLAVSIQPRLHAIAVLHRQLLRHPCRRVVYTALAGDVRTCALEANACDMKTFQREIGWTCGHYRALIGDLAASRPIVTSLMRSDNNHQFSASTRKRERDTFQCRLEQPRELHISVPDRTTWQPHSSVGWCNPRAPYFSVGWWNPVSFTFQFRIEQPDSHIPVSASAT